MLRSVGSKQLRKGAVRTADIRGGAVKLGKIDKKARRALKGQAGPAGATGPAGTFGSVVIRFVEFPVAKETTSSQEIAACAAGEVAVGGGVGFAGSPGNDDRIVYSGPGDGEGQPIQGETPTTWEGSLHNSEGGTKTSEGGTKTGRVFVVCAS